MTNSREHVCCQCGNTFYTSTVGKWIYRSKTADPATGHVRWFCGWECMNAYNKAHERIRKLDKELKK